MNAVRPIGFKEYLTLGDNICTKFEEEDEIVLEGEKSIFPNGLTFSSTDDDDVYIAMNDGINYILKKQRVNDKFIINLIQNIGDNQSILKSIDCDSGEVTNSSNSYYVPGYIFFGGGGGSSSGGSKSIYSTTNSSPSTFTITNTTSTFTMTTSTFTITNTTINNFSAHHHQHHQHLHHHQHQQHLHHHQHHQHQKI